MDPRETDSEDLQIITDAARLLREGGLVVFPTETVYGLGANARDDEACRRIFRAKERPPDNPLILHLGGIEQLYALAHGEPPQAAVRALETFAPGPITVVLRHNGSVSEVATTGLPTVAVRIPSHPVALALLKEADIPVAAPSANRSGRPSPTTYEMAVDAMGGRADMILDGGASLVGVESTILDCTRSPQRVLRPGGVTTEMLLDAGFDIEPADRRGSTASHVLAGPEDSARDGEAAEFRAPGSRYLHYKPTAPVFLVEAEDAEPRATAFLSAAEAESVGIMGMESAVDALDLRGSRGRALRAAQRYPTLEAFAQRVYSSFHYFDQLQCAAILALLPPGRGVGVAIRDRLSRAGTLL